jgi:diacylglycerol O-acyltransferase/trehalose O-mycolyltransferase
MDRRGLLAALLVGILALSTGCGQDLAQDRSAWPAVVAEKRLSGRLVELHVRSPALGRVATVRLLTPVGWRDRPRGREWPVLYLLPTCCGVGNGWGSELDLTGWPELRNVLVVMPEGGRAGFYSDWWNGGEGGAPRWETFHLSELRELLEQGYGAGRRRAIAGPSMGGHGALAYAARRPDLFRAAASYSGIVHTRYPSPNSGQLVHDILRTQGEDPAALWGNPLLQEALWRQHNPYDLAARLRGTAVFVSAGNGQRGPLDPPGTRADGLEYLLQRQATELVGRLHSAGVPVTADLYAGTHRWYYWERELRRSLPMLMSALEA